MIQPTPRPSIIRVITSEGHVMVFSHVTWWKLGYFGDSQFLTMWSPAIVGAVMVRDPDRIWVN